MCSLSRRDPRPARAKLHLTVRGREGGEQGCKSCRGGAGSCSGSDSGPNPESVPESELQQPPAPHSNSYLNIRQGAFPPTLFGGRGSSSIQVNTVSLVCTELFPKRNVYTTGKAILLKNNQTESFLPRL